VFFLMALDDRLAIAQQYIDENCGSHHPASNVSCGSSHGRS
jgi:hypothetical protein